MGGTAKEMIRRGWVARHGSKPPKNPWNSQLERTKRLVGLATSTSGLNQASKFGASEGDDLEVKE